METKSFKGIPVHPSRCCPYLGLAPFKEVDAPLFFGRDRDRDVLVANALSTRLTIYYGPSGAGKSSILRAGLVNRLRVEARENFELFGTPEAIAVYFASWRDDPIPALLTAVRTEIKLALPTEDAKLPVPANSLTETLRSWSDTLRTDLIIALDQFEEFFLYQHGIREQFARQFADILMSPSARVNFIISLREDALSRLDAFQSFVPRLFDNCLRLEHLGEKGARDAIEAPLSVPSGTSETPRVDLEPGLLDAVLQDVRIGQVRLGSGGPTSASRIPNPDGSEVRVESAYLQLVMERLWEECARDAKRTLSLQKYISLGRADGVVRTHLDKALSDFNDAERDIAARVFQDLVTPSGSKIAHWLDDLANWAKRPADRVGLVLEKLCRSELRILRNVRPADQRDRARYEIFHDVIAGAILEWQQKYYQGRRDEATRMLSKRRADRELAAAARESAAKLEQEKIRRIKQSRIYLFTALVAALLLAGFTAINWKKAENAEADAKAKAKAAIAAENEARAKANDAIDAGKRAKEAEANAKAKAEAAIIAETDAICAREVSEEQRKEQEAKKLRLSRELEELRNQIQIILKTANALVTRSRVEATVKKTPANELGTKSRNAGVASLEELIELLSSDVLRGEATISRIEPEQLAMPPLGGDGWLYAGRINREDEWGDQSFRRLSGSLMKQLPNNGDILRAGTYVNIRSLPNRFSFTGGWASQPLVGLLKLDEFIEVQKIEKVKGPEGDPWRRIWVLGKKVQEPRWVEFKSKTKESSQIIQDPGSDFDFTADSWPGTKTKIFGDLKVLTTGSRTWFIGFSKKGYTGSSIQVGPNQSIPSAIIKRSRIESYHTYDAKPEIWDKGQQ